MEKSSKGGAASLFVQGRNTISALPSAAYKLIINSNAVYIIWTDSAAQIVSGGSHLDREVLVIVLTSF